MAWKSKCVQFAQYGFRDGKSTTDAIFLLHGLIQKVLSKNCKLYSIFIDYERAFDTVLRDALWMKLMQEGISTKFVAMLQSMYAEVKSCVRIASDTKLSDFFDVTLGLKQGELTVVPHIVFIIH